MRQARPFGLFDRLFKNDKTSKKAEPEVIKSVNEEVEEVVTPAQAFVKKEVSVEEPI